MAAPARASVLTRVLVRVLALNLAVAIAKLAFGYATGAISIISDGFHSLTDGASNVMAIVAMRAARKPPDDDHPYGHRKYETLAAAGIFVFLLLVVMEVVRGALDYARANGLKVAPVCSYVRTYMRRHEETHDLLAEGYGV